MKENTIKHFKKAVMVVSIILTIFFHFTLNSYADEPIGVDILPEVQEILSKAKVLDESGDKAGAMELILNYIKAKLETAIEKPQDAYYISGDINDIAKINKEALELVGGIDKVIKVYEEVYTVHPENETILGVYGWTLFKTQQYAEAAPLLEKYYAVSENKEAWNLLSAAQAYYLAKNPAEAKRVVDEMMKLPDAPQPYWPATFYQICIANGDVDEAGSYLELYNSTARKVVIAANPSAQDQAIADPPCPQESEDTESTPHNIKEVDEPPRLAQVYMPIYPIRAIVEGIEGRVVLKFLVGRDGYAHDPDIFSTDPEGYFEESALDAVAEYRFIPAKKDGKCVDCLVKLPVVFELPKNPAVQEGE